MNQNAVDGGVSGHVRDDGQRKPTRPKPQQAHRKAEQSGQARAQKACRIKRGASLKKKIAVALARQLAIDLWCWRTGRAAAAELGWTLRSAKDEVGSAK